VTWRSPPWRWPLFLQILLGLVLGIAVGLAFGPAARSLEVPAKLVLRMLGALAPALVFSAIVRVLLTTFLDGKTVLRLGSLLLQNTLAAIGIGLFVSSVIRPGDGAHLEATKAITSPRADILTQLLENIPDSLAKPFVDNRVIALVILAVALGIAARKLESKLLGDVERLFEAAYSILLTILGWVLKIVPLAVFAKVAAIVGVSGFSPLFKLGWFVLAVLSALCLQALYYLTRIRLGSWVRPLFLLQKIRDPLVMAFSTASSTITMPVTYDRLLHGVGLRERSASLQQRRHRALRSDGSALRRAIAGNEPSTERPGAGRTHVSHCLCGRSWHP
jgi:Na+/H+-dicarboxylate symporter